MASLTKEDIVESPKIMANYFKDEVACITGAASGIGRATALAFARDGSRKLVLADISVPGLEGTRDSIKAKHPDVEVEIVKTDVTSEESVKAYYNAAISRFDRIDCVANVAGYISKHGPITMQTEEEYERTFNINLLGVFLCQKFALQQFLRQEPLPGIEQRGAIVNVGSLCSTAAIPGMSAYSATKGGVFGLTKNDALDYGPQKIRINCLAPGNTLTPMLEGASTEAFRAHFAAGTPYQRLADPIEMANTISWLCSPMASYVTGILVPVDGGLNLNTAL
ncbi:hypothetical protein CLAIMM_03884 [Cladophialophora immunda]|nr:hypothetical protein CLAIMM_03884 [Cladophialophora immunda]